MARSEIILGTPPKGIGGDPPRVASQKINAMTLELYQGLGTPEAPLPAIRGGTGHKQGMTWGFIGGNITGQDDLNAALNSKVTGNKQGLVTASVLFAGNGPTIINNFNVASVTKVATGIYDINFLVPMDNTAYVVVGMACDDSAVQSIMYENGANGSTRSVGKVRVVAGVPGGSTRDFTLMNVFITGGKN
jgi:hypothetical protein